MAATIRNLRVPRGVAELVRGLHPELKRKVRASLRAILDDPLTGKTLHDDLDGLRSYAVGSFRIIYRITRRSRVVELVTIGPRARVYENTLRLIRRAEPTDAEG